MAGRTTWDQLQDYALAMEHQYELAMITAFCDAAAEAGALAAKQLTSIAEVFTSGVARPELAKIHESIARQARSSVRRSYGQSVGRRGGPSGYRSDASGPMRRYSGGKLRSALAGDDWLIGTADSITLDVSPLDRVAIQWARLNFGAGARGRGSLPGVQVRFGDLVVAVVGLDEPARPGFIVPAGYWEAGEGNRIGGDPGRRGMDAFYVSSSSRYGNGRLRPEGSGLSKATAPRQGRVVSRGIAGRNFLDRAPQTVATLLPRRYLILHQDLYRRGLARARPANVTVATTPGVRRPSDLSMVAGQLQARVGRRTIT